jgi:hypothetical protein
MSRVFISHAHSDKGFARKLAADLRAGGHTVWIDEGEIDIGDSLIEKIRQGIDMVDYVVAVISNHSVSSEWVKRELDVASNREIQERRVVVLPLIIDSVELPGFLKGKFFGDCRTEEKYADSLKALGRKLKPESRAPDLKNSELARLKAELDETKRVLAAHEVELTRTRTVAFKAKSENLQGAITNANKAFPLHEPINNTYAFEVDGIAVTLDYLLHCIGKAQYKGSHPLESLLTIDDKWGDVELMLDAYSDLLDARRRGRLADDKLG